MKRVFIVINLKKLVVDFFSVLLLLVFVISGISIYIGYQVLNPERVGLTQIPSDYDLKYEDVTIRNRVDNVKLQGWWIPSTRYDYTSQKVVIFSHSYGDNRVNMPIQTLKLAKRLSSEGYHVLMYDFRKSGESGGRYSTIGSKEQSDLQSAITFVKEEKGIHQIALLGWSMGAATSIIVGSESPDVKAVIADSPFSDLKAYSVESFTYWTGLPKPVGKVLMSVAEDVFTDLNFGEVKPYMAARNYNGKGLLLIHSEKDGAISYKHSEIIHNNALDAELWITHKGGHIRNYKWQKELYEERILSFLKKYFRDDQFFTKA